MDNTEFILGITLGLLLALFFGFITQKLKLSPIIGYLIAGFIVGPYSPGIVINDELAKQLAEIGIILLMFSIGLNFHPKDLLSVKKISLPGALIEISLMTTLGTFIGRYFDLPFKSSVLFGISISIASTVILMRVLSDNKTLHTPTGHIAIGWLIVEDFFTIFALVLIPECLTLIDNTSQIVTLLLMTIGKVTLLVFCILFIGKKILPSVLIFIARTGSRDLFTLAILVIALGIAVLSTKLFGASMALGAFLAGMLVGQSDFGTRATAEALPIKDTFAVLFFLSIGMLFNPSFILEDWKFCLTTLLLVIICKPIIATFIMLFFLKQPLKKSVEIGVSLAQIGEFSFILASLGITLNLFSASIANAIITTSIISITLNPILYKNINFILRCLNKIGIKEKNAFENDTIINVEDNFHKIIIVGFGPVGQCLTKILSKNGFNIVIIEMNIDTVRAIKLKHDKKIQALYGDANNREILHKAGIEYARAFIISTSLAPSKELARFVYSINPQIRILAHTQYLSEAKILNNQSKKLQLAFSGEFAVALSLCKFLMKELNFDDELIKEECNNIEEILL